MNMCLLGTGRSSQSLLFQLSDQQDTDVDLDGLEHGHFPKDAAQNGCTDHNFLTLQTWPL